jgi:hypothetical protein
MNNPVNLMQMLGQIKTDPFSFLGRKYNIPQGMTNPNDIIQHLMNTGQVSQQQYNAVNQAARKYFNK